MMTSHQMEIDPDLEFPLNKNDELHLLSQFTEEPVDVKLCHAVRLNSHEGVLREFRKSMKKQDDIFVLQNEKFCLQNDKIQESILASERAFNEVKLLRASTFQEINTVHTQVNLLNSAQTLTTEVIHTLSKEQQMQHSELHRLDLSTRSLEKAQAENCMKIDRTSMESASQFRKLMAELEIQKNRMAHFEGLLKKPAISTAEIGSTSVVTSRDFRLDLNTKVLSSHKGHNQFQHQQRLIQNPDLENQNQELPPVLVAEKVLEQIPDPPEPLPKKRRKSGLRSSINQNNISSPLEVIPETPPVEAVLGQESSSLPSVSNRKRRPCPGCGKKLMSSYIDLHMSRSCPGVREKEVTEKTSEKIPEIPKANIDESPQLEDENSNVQGTALPEPESNNTVNDSALHVGLELGEVQQLQDTRILRPRRGVPLRNYKEK